MRRVAESFGYEAYDGPLLEDVELYKAKSGEELINEQIYSFSDRGGRHVAIRPEMTPTLARMVSKAHREMPRPLRWYSIPNLMRYERPQRGRLREHWQFNCDIFGAGNNHGEIEILQVAIALFNQFGATSQHFEILLNHRSLIGHIFQDIVGADSAQMSQLYKIVDRSKKISSEVLDKMLSETGLANASLDKLHQYLELKNFDELQEYLIEYHQKPLIEDFAHFHSLLKDLGLDSYVKYDPSVVRGLDYYTGIVFEIFDCHPDNKRALCGGGSYAHLLEIFDGPGLPGTGFGLGDVTLKNFLELHQLLPNLERANIDLLVTYQGPQMFARANVIAQQLRQQGLHVLFQLETIKMAKAFSIASKRGIDCVLLFGERELEGKKFQIKNIKAKQQLEFQFDETSNASDWVIQQTRTRD